MVMVRKGTDTYIISTLTACDITTDQFADIKTSPPPPSQGSRFSLFESSFTEPSHSTHMTKSQFLALCQNKYFQLSMENGYEVESGGFSVITHTPSAVPAQGEQVLLGVTGVHRERADALPASCGLSL